MRAAFQRQSMTSETGPRGIGVGCWLGCRVLDAISNEANASKSMCKVNKEDKSGMWRKSAKVHNETT